MPPDVLSDRALGQTAVIELQWEDDQAVQPVTIMRVNKGLTDRGEYYGADLADCMTQLAEDLENGSVKPEIETT